MKTDTVGNTLKKETTIDGLTYELWNTEGGRIRVVDEDSGEVISIKNYKDMPRAEAEYEDTIAKASR